MADSTGFWNRLAKNYDKRVIRKYGETYRKTVDASKKYLDVHRTALDFACGTGITTIELAPFAKRIIAIDTSREMIDRAREKTASRHIGNVEYLAAGISDAQFDGLQVDVVFAFNILHFFRDVDPLLARIRKLLSPGGLFISATDCMGERRSPGTVLLYLLSGLKIVPYVKMYSIRELEDRIKLHGFQIIEARELYDRPPNHFIAAGKLS